MCGTSNTFIYHHMAADSRNHCTVVHLSFLPPILTLMVYIMSCILLYIFKNCYLSPQTIHVAIVCAGYNASRDVVTLVKSVLFHRYSNASYISTCGLSAQHTQEVACDEPATPSAFTLKKTRCSTGVGGCCCLVSAGASGPG